MAIELLDTDCELIKSELSDLSGVVSGPWYDVKDLYSKGPHGALAGTILNYILTNDMPCFIMSKRVLEKLIKDDPNNKTKTMNGSQYKYVIKLLIQNKHIVCIKPASDFKSGRRVGSLFRLINKELRQLFENIDELELNYTKTYIVYNKIPLDITRAAILLPKL